MRYKCERCEQLIKDKFIFGLVHLCLTDEEYAYKLSCKRMMDNKLTPNNGRLGSLNNFDIFK